jgi:hypothetical protein
VAFNCHSSTFGVHSPTCGIHLQWPKLLNAGLAEVDPELLDIIEHEKNRQYKVSHIRCWCSAGV